MATIAFKVTNTALRMGHKMTSFANDGGLCMGILTLGGSGNKTLFIYGLNEQSPVVHNSATIAGGNATGHLYVPASDFPAYVAMVRDNPEIFVNLDSGNPLENIMITNFAIS